MLDCDFWFRYSLYSLYIYIYKLLTISAFFKQYHTLRAITWQESATSLIFLSRSLARSSSRFSSLIYSKNQPSAGFHSDLISMIAVASRIVSRASCERRPTSRNVTSDIRETKCMLRRRERDRSRGHRDHIVNWLSMRLLRCVSSK